MMPKIIHRFNEYKMMKLFCAVAMCSVAWADVANFDMLIRCSNDARISRLEALQGSLPVEIAKISNYIIALESLVPEVEKICSIIMEHPAKYALDLLQLGSVLTQLHEIKKAASADATPTNQITVKQLLENIETITYLLVKMTTTIEVLEKKCLKSGVFGPSELEKALSFTKDVTYKEFVASVKLLGANKVILLSLMTDLQNIRAPLYDVMTENGKCSTKEIYKIVGMPYKDEVVIPEVVIPNGEVVIPEVVIPNGEVVIPEGSNTQ